VKITLVGRPGPIKRNYRLTLLSGSSLAVTIGTGVVRDGHRLLLSVGIRLVQLSNSVQPAALYGSPHNC
jgi:hypothetical protein